MKHHRIGLGFALVLGFAVPASAEDNHVLSLSSVGQYVTVPHSSSLAASSEITVEYWVRIDNESFFGRIGKTAPSSGQWGIQPSAEGVTGFFVHGVGYSGPATHPIHEWYHVAGTWRQSSSAAKVYINGELQSSSVGNGAAMADVSYSIVIGYQPFYADSQLYGAVDNFRVWTVARSQSEIQGLMHHQILPSEEGNYPGLVLSLSFENGANDASPFDNHGLFMGGASVVVDNSFLVPADCDGDGTPDAVEIQKGAMDRNSNGVPDTCECLADLTGDGQVNGGDLSIVLGFWGTPAKTLPAADLNGDGTVNAQDLSMLLGSWGPCPN